VVLDCGLGRTIQTQPARTLIDDVASSTGRPKWQGPFNDQADHQQDLVSVKRTSRDPQNLYLRRMLDADLFGGNAF
jgi:hypothetical protein